MFEFLLAPDVEELLISYLTESGFQNVSTEWFKGIPIPFIIVNCLDSPDDYVEEYALVSVQTFHRDRTLASTLSLQVHRAIKNMIGKPVLMDDGSYAHVDSLGVRERPHWENYDSKEVRRYCARYRVETRCTK